MINFDVPDFDNDKQIQAQRRIAAAFKARVDCCVAMVKEQLQVSLETEDEAVPPFQFFNSLGNIFEIKRYHSSDPDHPLQVYLVTYDWHFGYNSRNNSGGSAQCFFGLLHLPASFPVTLVTRERLVDKIVGWFSRNDIDLPAQKKFSGAFRVVTRDAEKLNQLLQRASLDELASFAGLEAEFMEDKCLFRSSAVALVDDEETNSRTEDFIKLAKTMRKAFWDYNPSTSFNFP